ncbi:hypothetical protein ES332_D01G208600v1 [Gossypium tomentosum]|uniref:Uncharacterized protein n=1 Tax=Gossypium tomentosum TaxID=34277 RepID=A0A5D2MBI0_GOSTO|nr:hypothetical protein ES332_D01G208600v1 [Gossypium tomentosum]
MNRPLKDSPNLAQTPMMTEGARIRPQGTLPAWSNRRRRTRVEVQHARGEL